eukprot:TRINITY_DN57056_c0_g1_i1.p1 TRINITY_DN57056_c0_g1~~TRINITY_DN57056_c0_g1_i1.p1  ORF type:complete len:356 (+),score=35.48 TRINITY_DN57056_c0_g1_i1:144-1211(+)
MSCAAINAVQEQLSSVCETLRKELCNSVSVDALPVLLQVVETCKAIQLYAEQARAAVEVKGLIGDTFSVEVTVTDTIQSLKASVAKTMDIQPSKLSLVPSGGNSQTFPAMQLVSAITPVPAAFDFAIQEPLGFIPNLKLWLASQDSTDPLVDVVSGNAYKIISRDGRAMDAPEMCNEGGRRGLQMIENFLLCRGDSGEPFKSDALTISYWMLSPFKARQAEYSGDMPSPSLLYQFEAIVVGDHSLAVGDQRCLLGGREPSPLDFDLTSLSPGWHHVCEVMGLPEVQHYVDGKLVGSMPVPNDMVEVLEAKEWRFPEVVCMPQMHREGPGRVVVSDVCLFASAASAEQVQMLANRT